MDIEKLKSAHKFSSGHKNELLKEDVCGCFYCLKIFKPSEIAVWINDKGYTAMCPYCGIDSIIGKYSGFPITTSFLDEMRKYWF